MVRLGGEMAGCLVMVAMVWLLLAREAVGGSGERRLWLGWNEEPTEGRGSSDDALGPRLARGTTGRAVRVSCYEPNLLVTVDRDLFGSGHRVMASDLTLGTAGCRFTNVNDQSDTVIFNRSLPDCGIERKMTDEFLVYSTLLNYIPQPTTSPVIRTNSVSIPIECRFPRRGNVSSNGIKPTWVPFSSTKWRQEHLSFTLRLMNNDWSAERISNVYHLGNLINIQAAVSAENHVPLKVFIERCVATLSPDKDSDPSYSIIDFRGCLMDSKVVDSFSSFVSPRSRDDKLGFKLDAFRFFEDSRDSIFVRCELKAISSDTKPDPWNKACYFHKLNHTWVSVEGSSESCRCCEVSDCSRRGRGKRSSQSGGAEVSGPAGFQWEAEVSLGPIVVLQAELGGFKQLMAVAPSTITGTRPISGSDSAVILALAGSVVLGALICASLVTYYHLNRKRLQ